MFESLSDPTGYKRFRREYDAQNALVVPDIWENFRISKMRFFNHRGVFFEDEWLSVVDRGVFHIASGPYFLVHTLSGLTNYSRLQGWFYFDFRSFAGVVASRSSAPTLAELGRASRPPLDDQKFAKVLESLRRRFDGIGFKASYRAWDGQLFWGGDDGSHRFAALYQYCIEHDVAHYDAFRLIVREIDADRISAIQKDWSLFLAPPEIGRAINRAATGLCERRRNLDVSRFFALTVPLESAAISAPIVLLVVRADSPGAAILSADSRLGALNPLLDQMCRKQTINIQGLINAVEQVDKDRERGRKL
jgi:hypothetical protein